MSTIPHIKRELHILWTIPELRRAVLKKWAFALTRTALVIVAMPSVIVCLFFDLIAWSTNKVAEAVNKITELIFGTPIYWCQWNENKIIEDAHTQMSPEEVRKRLGLKEL